MIIITFILFCVYASLEGVKEAYLYHYRNQSYEKKAHELHPLFAAQRSTVLLIVTAITKDLYLLVSLICVFSFFHNGCYFLQRNKLDKNIYKAGFKAESHTSTAILEFGFAARTSMFISGLMIFLWDVLK